MKNHSNNIKSVNLRRILSSLILFFILIAAIGNSSTVETNFNARSARSDSNNSYKTIPSKLLRLINSYPDFFDSADENHLYWKDGTIMIYDDGIKDKSHDEMLDNPDIEDMLSQEYIKGEDWENPPSLNYEPGRIRHEPFFLKMYGNNSDEVAGHLVNVDWIDGSKIRFTKINGASDSLAKVVNDLKQLPESFLKYLKNIGGTFMWRNIAGTNRLSNHSFGSAIDIDTNYSDYWKWSKTLIYKNRIPMEIVNIFEKHGFIWGGRWYHYDTMHFEYRPELL